MSTLEKEESWEYQITLNPRGYFLRASFLGYCLEDAFSIRFWLSLG